MLVAVPGEQPADVVEAAVGASSIRGAGVEARWAPGGRLVLGPLAVLLAATPDGTGWSVTVDLDPAAAVYGGGASSQAVNLRGRTRRCVNRNAAGVTGVDVAYLNVPFFWSDRGWGVYVHTGGAVEADIGDTDAATVRLNWSDVRFDLFLLLGDAARLLVAFQELTGRSGVLPDWAFGVWTSRCSYLSIADAEEVLDRYEEAACPVDVLHVDAWQKGSVWQDLSCNWTVDRARWPQGWAGRLRRRGVRVSAWLNPYVRRGTAVGDEAVARGFVLRDATGGPVGTPDLPDRLVVDFTSGDARSWWRDLVMGLAVGEDVDALKSDFGDEVPPAAVAADGRRGTDLANEYALLYQRATAEVLAQVRPTGPPTLFSRAGTAGSQRHPCHWVGDTPSTWAGMQSALRACLSLSLSGLTFVGSDVGGFWTPVGMRQTTAAFHAMDPDLFTADVDPELYARWTQWGALSPVMRFHGTGRREPWAYPEPYRSVALAACRMRRELRPYLVEAAGAAVATRLPMMLPMVVAFPGDRAARDADLQYLLGNDLLVAPVLRTGGSVTLWVPPGTWTPLAGRHTLTGPGWTTVELPLEAMPGWRRSPREAEIP